MLTKDFIVEEVRKHRIPTFPELARKLGVQYSSDWEDGISSAIPGLKHLLASFDYRAMVAAAKRRGDDEEAGRYGVAIVREVHGYINAGIDPARPELAMTLHAECLGVAASPKKTRKRKEPRKERKMAKQTVPENLDPVPVDALDGDAVEGCVLGYTGEDYCGRKVILFKRKPGMFGIEGCSERVIKATLHKGIINMSSMKDKPTPYWAVLDAASELGKEFTRQEVIDLAMRTLEAHGSTGEVKACQVAWDVLKNHQNHPRKKTCGMPFMVDLLGDKRMSVRGRNECETQQFFEARKQRTKETTLRRPRKDQDVPTEEKPVAVVVGNAR
jgi:hypothetical protein